MNNERYNGYRYSLSNLQETTIAVSVFKVLFIVHFLYHKIKTRLVAVTERVFYSFLAISMVVFSILNTFSTFSKPADCIIFI